MVHEQASHQCLHTTVEDLEFIECRRLHEVPFLHVPFLQFEQIGLLLAPPIATEMMTEGQAPEGRNKHQQVVQQFQLHAN